MFSMTKIRELDEVERQDADVNRHHYGEDVKFDLDVHWNDTGKKHKPKR